MGLGVVFPPELWERCARLRAENMKLATRNARRLYLLRGIVRCGVCGRGFHGVSTHRRWFYYQCNSRVQSGVTYCGNHRVRAADLEGLVWREVVHFAESPGRVAGLLQKARAAASTEAKEGAVARVEKQLAAKATERECVITWARQGRITGDEMDAQLASLRAETAALEAERVRLSDARRSADEARGRLRAAESFLDDLARRVSLLEGEARAAVLRQLVPRVVISPRDDGRVKVAAT